MLKLKNLMVKEETKKIMNSDRKLAKLIYGDANFKILEEGSYVICAVTNKEISLRDLKYWSVDKQEAYIDAKASLEASK